MDLRRSILIAVCAFIAVESTVLSAQDPVRAPPDEATMARLQAGDWVVENDVSDARVAAASILILIRAPVERIWATITTCRNVEIFLAGLKFCEVLEDTGTYALTHQVVDKGWTTPRLDYTFETRREPYRHMEFNLVKGNLEIMQGSWDFTPVAEGIVVRHVLMLRPLVPAPRWLVRRNLKQDLPEMMQCIRGLSAGSGSPQAEAADLEKCPGDLP